MASKRVQEIVDRFSAELLEALETEATESIQDRLRGVLGASAKDLAPIKRRKTTKGYTVLRPCPIPDCKEIAAPRYQMVCKGHSQSLSREEILVARDNAIKPGGAWADLKPGRKVA
jgi:hypothetical protein